MSFTHKPQAVAAAQKALEISKIPRIKFLAGRHSPPPVK
jgi:hypothetical protein